MKIKCGKYLADWRASHGVRHRKAFTANKAAEKHQLKMRIERENNVRPSDARRPSPRPSVRSRKHGPTQPGKRAHLRPSAWATCTAHNSTASCCSPASSAGRSATPQPRNTSTSNFSAHSSRGSSATPTAIPPAPIDPPVVSVTLRPSAGLLPRVQRLDRSQVPQVSRILRNLGFMAGGNHFITTELTVFRFSRCVRYRTHMPVATDHHREFAEVERGLDETVSQLKATHDPRTTRRLLREMRRLLVQADRLLDLQTE